jgi:hypothetical protein
LGARVQGEYGNEPPRCPPRSAHPCRRGPCSHCTRFPGTLEECRSRGRGVWSVARVLDRKAVPFLFYTGHFDGECLPAEWRGRPLLVKTARLETIIDTIRHPPRKSRLIVSRIVWSCRRNCRGVPQSAFRRRPCGCLKGDREMIAVTSAPAPLTGRRRAEHGSCAQLFRTSI